MWGRVRKWMCVCVCVCERERGNLEFVVLSVYAITLPLSICIWSYWIMNRNKQEHMVTTQINLSFTISKVQFNKTKYKSSLTIQVEFNPIEFVLLNFNQILTGRQLNFISIKSNSFKVGNWYQLTCQQTHLYQ